MSHNGRLIYEYARATPAVYEIRGSLIYEYGRATPAKYEIRGNLIYEHACATQAVYEIRGNSSTSMLVRPKPSLSFVELTRRLSRALRYTTGQLDRFG